jgi:thiamine-phosphate pyrophosphorylase
MDPVARIIDANANRASEALRTLEDLVRFALDDGPLSARLKDLRHTLHSALRRLPEDWLPANRSTATDVGTSNAAAGEYTRSGLADLAGAAGSRLAEALRSIEECAKTLPTEDGGPLARAVEGVRYASYDLAAAIQLRLPGQVRQWKVCVLVTESICRRPWREVVERALDGGADAIQLREKGLGDAALLDRATWIADRCRAASAQFIVNDRPDIALLAGADGVHLGQEDLAPSSVRRLVGRRLVIGMSTHNATEAARAVDEAADYCGIGAMFPTSVKPTAEQAGVAWLRDYLADPRFARIPHLAIGGITPENIASLVDNGCRGVAVSACVCGAERPDAVVRALRSAWP